MRVSEGMARGHMTCYVGVFIRLGGLHDLRETKPYTVVHSTCSMQYSSTQYM